MPDLAILDIIMPRMDGLERHGAPVRLTVTEFRILYSLARQPGYVRTREQLLAEAFPHDAYMSDRTIDCDIRRIRGKLEDADAEFDGIETLYGPGYRLRSSRTAAAKLPFSRIMIVSRTMIGSIGSSRETARLDESDMYYIY